MGVPLVNGEKVPEMPLQTVPDNYPPPNSNIIDAAANEFDFNATAPYYHNPTAEVERQARLEEGDLSGLFDFDLYDGAVAACEDADDAAQKLHANF